MTTMLRSLLLLFAIILGPFAFAPEVHATQAQRFPFEAEAKQHRPADIVVWLNVPTHVHHFKGMRWFGNTKSGAYVCRKEADAEGDRATRNGQ